VTILRLRTHDVLEALVLFYKAYAFHIEQVDGPAVRALGVRSRKLSNVRKDRMMGDQNLLS
jgi:hypothetical protein